MGMEYHFADGLYRQLLRHEQIYLWNIFHEICKVIDSPIGKQRRCVFFSIGAIQKFFSGLHNFVVTCEVSDNYDSELCFRQFTKAVQYTTRDI